MNSNHNLLINTVAGTLLFLSLLLRLLLKKVSERVPPFAILQAKAGVPDCHWQSSSYYQRCQKYLDLLFLTQKCYILYRSLNFDTKVCQGGGGFEKLTQRE